MKIKFFTKIKKAIFRLEDYQEFSMEKLKEPIKYVLKLMLLFTLILTTALCIKSYIIINQITNSLEQDQINFYFENDKLISSEEIKTFSDNSELVGITINPNNNKVDKNKNKIYIVANSDELLIGYNGLNIIEGKYKDIFSSENLNNIRKENIIDSLKLKNSKTTVIYFIIIEAAIIYIYFTIQLLFDSLLLALLGYILTKMTLIRFKFKPVWNMAIYSFSLSTVLSLIFSIINIITGFEIKYFQYAYELIAYIYLMTAILMIKTTLIRQKIEIEKIVKEQEKVKKESEEEQQPEEEKKSEDNNKENKDNENEHNQEPKGNEA